MNMYRLSQIRHPEKASDFSSLLSLSVLRIVYRLSGDVRKQAVIKIHLGIRGLLWCPGNVEQNGHSISPSSLCPHCAHRVIPSISSSSSCSIAVGSYPFCSLPAHHYFRHTCLYKSRALCFDLHFPG